MYAGCLVGSNSVMGSVFSTLRRTDAVQPVSSSAEDGVGAAARSMGSGALSLLIARLLRAMGWERRNECENEEQHHHADEDEIRQRDENEAPVNVGSRRVHWQPPCVVGVSGGSVQGSARCLEGHDVA